MAKAGAATTRGVKDDMREGWTKQTAGWVRHADLLEDWSKEGTALLLQGARAKPGDVVLDVATGPGATALALAGAVAPGGRVVATDLIPGMVRGAERIAKERGVTNVEFRQADGESLPFPDAGFDVVTCRFGVMFFGDPEGGLREFHRVLRAGGRASILVWGPVEANPFFVAVTKPFRSRLPPAPPPPEDAPTPFRFGPAGKLTRAMRAAGFEDAREESREIAWNCPATPEAFWETARDLSPEVFGEFRKALGEAAFEEAKAEVLADARKRYDGTHVRFTARTVLGTGTRRA